MRGMDRFAPPDNYPKTFTTCEECGGDIYEGDQYIKTDDGNVHECCFYNFAFEQLNAERADATYEGGVFSYIVRKLDSLFNKYIALR